MSAMWARKMTDLFTKELAHCHDAPIAAALSPALLAAAASDILTPLEQELNQGYLGQKADCLTAAVVEAADLPQGLVCPSETQGKGFQGQLHGGRVAPSQHLHCASRCPIQKPYIGSCC